MQTPRPWIRVACCAIVPWWLLAGATTDQYTYRAIDYPGAGLTAGYTITPSGEIGGYTCAGMSCQGFLYRDGADPVPINPPGAVESFVTGVQRGGFLLSGQYWDVRGVAHGYVWDRSPAGEFITIDPSGATYTEVADMNPAGDLAGNYQDAGGIFHGFVERNGVLTPFDIPGASFTAAYGINPPGDLVGTYCDATGCHAYLLVGGVGGVTTTIDVPGSVATYVYGINSIGQLVGDYCVQDGTCHGYVRNPDGEFVTIDPPGSGFTIAFAINPAGQITGMFCDATGCHAFVATPEYGQTSRTSTVRQSDSGRLQLPSIVLHSGKGALARSLSRR